MTTEAKSIEFYLLVSLIISLHRNSWLGASICINLSREKVLLQSCALTILYLCFHRIAFAKTESSLNVFAEEFVPSNSKVISILNY